MLDIERTLKFLAWDNVVANNDGFWIRASDYNLYRDKDGRFHFIPHDANETFSSGGGPGGFGGPGGRGPGGSSRVPGRFGPPEGFDPDEQAGPRGMAGWRSGGPGGRGGVELDPLVAANDPTKPLLSKLLAVPALRARYLGYVRDMAETCLDWQWLGPRVQAYRALIADDVKRDTRKLDTFEAFEQGTAAGDPGEGAVQRGRQVSLKEFADQRRDSLLKVIHQ